MGVAEATITHREDTSQVRLLHARRAVDAVFDDPNLVSCAGLVPLMRLAEQVDLVGLVAGQVRPDLSTGPTRAVRPRRSWASWIGWSRCSCRVLLLGQARDLAVHLPSRAARLIP
jgi:hypothetical protein